MPMKETTSTTSVFDIKKSKNLPTTAASDFFSKHWNLIANLSHTEIARRAKISDSQLSRIISGKTVPSTEVLEALADALQLAPGEKLELTSCGNGLLFWDYVENKIAYLKQQSKSNNEEPFNMGKFYTRAGISKQKYNNGKRHRTNCSLKTALGFCIAFNEGIKKEDRLEKAEQLLKLAGYRFFKDKEEKLSFIQKQLEAGVSNVNFIEDDFCRKTA